MKKLNVTKKMERRAGFTLAGTLFNVTVASLLVLGSGTLSTSNLRDLPAMMAFAERNNEEQNVSRLLAQDIRRASSVPNASTHQLVLKVSHGYAAETVTYSYDATARIVTRQDHSSSQVLLKNVESFAFSLLQRPAANATEGALIAAAAIDARAITCHWTCSHRVLGAKLSSESFGMGPIVLRNRG